MLLLPLFTLGVLWGQREAGRKEGAQSVPVYSDGFVSVRVVACGVNVGNFITNWRTDTLLKIMYLDVFNADIEITQATDERHS